MKLRPKRFSMFSLMESQGHRCAICHTVFVLDRGYAYPAWPSMVKVDRSLPRSYKNCVALCHVCAGRQANYPSLMEYWDRGSKPIERIIPEINNDTVAAICDTIKAEGHAELLTGAAIEWITERYGRAPISAAPLIAKNWIASATFVHADKKEKNKRRAAKWISDGIKRSYMERQAHRCVYCLSEMEGNDVFSLRYATWEHVVGMADGGVTSKKNMVLACRFCNSHREELKMTAYQYAEWACQNRDKISKMVEDRTKGLIKKIKTKGPGWYRARQKKTPLFSHSE